MAEPPPPSYDDAITGNFPDAPPPKPSSNHEISVSTSFLGPERYKAPETIVPFPSSPEPAASSLPPSPGHDRETRRVTTPRISPTATVNNRPSPSATVVTANNWDNNDENSGSPNKSQCIKLIIFIILILGGIGILYFALSGGQDEELDDDYNYDQPKVYRTTTTTTPRPSGPDDCKTQPPQIVEKRGFGSFQNCHKNYKEEYYNKSTCAFSCTHGHILSTSPGVLDPGYNSNSPKTRIVFTCVRAKWVAPGDKDQKIKCLTTFEHVKENVG